MSKQASRSTSASRALEWTANDGPQTDFILCNTREILYGGAKGGGKTDAIGPKALIHVQQYGQWATVLILRQSFPQLTEIMERMRPLCLAAGARWHEQRKTWRFRSGARIIFGHLGDGCDPYWGQEYSLIIVDEVTRCIDTESDYLKLLGSLRNSHGIPCSVILTSNPGGQGHGWVKQRFMGVPPMTVQRDDKTGLERVFIPASLKDNPALPPEYRAQLEQMSEAERKAFLEGDWDAFEGTVFKLERGVHTWTWQDFRERTGRDRIPEDWTRYRAMDWGYAKPFAIYWIAVDYEGRGYVYREWYGCQRDRHGNPIPNEGIRMEPELVAERIKRIEEDAKETRITGIADPACWAKGKGDYGGGPSIQEAMAKQGIFWIPGKNDRIQGKLQLHQRLHYERDDKGQVTEWPGLIFLAPECPHALRTIPALEYDEHIVEDVDTSMEDHAYDAIRYWCMSRPWATPEKPKPKGWRDKLKPGSSTRWMG